MGTTCSNRGAGSVPLTSSAPISQPAPCGRVSPSRSAVVMAETLTPAFCAQESDPERWRSPLDCLANAGRHDFDAAPSRDTARQWLKVSCVAAPTLLLFQENPPLGSYTLPSKVRFAGTY